MSKKRYVPKKIRPKKQLPKILSSEKRRTHESNEHTQGKPEDDNSSKDWKSTAIDAVWSLHRTSWIPNLVVGVALGLIFLALTPLVNNDQSRTIAFGVGATAIFWVILVAVVIEQGKPNIGHSVSPPQTPIAPSSDSPQTISGTTAPALPPDLSHPRPTPRFSEVSEFIRIGTGSFSIAAQKSQIEANPLKLLAIGNDVLITVKLKDKTLFVDTNIYWKLGANPAKLIENVLSSRPPGWDRNWNDHAIEVVNEDMIPVFQLVYSGNDFAAVTGMFFHESVIAMVDDFQVGSVPISTNAFELYNVKRIFKYPSTQFEGVLETEEGRLKSQKEKNRMQQYKRAEDAHKRMVKSMNTNANATP